MNGLLQQGRQTIYVTATNCAGTGRASTRRSPTAHCPTGAGFQQLAPVELVQSVQSPYNPVPLIAGGPNGTKRTIARVPLGATGVTAPITGVSGRLTATRPDGSRPGGPLTIDSLNTISVAPDQTLVGARSDLDNTLNFELPPEWMTEGQLHVQLEQLKIEGTQTLLPCQYCDNFGGQSAIEDVPPGAPAARSGSSACPSRRRGGPGPVSPRQMDFDFLASWLGRAYPTAEVQMTQAALPVSLDQPGFEDEDGDANDENRDGFLCDDVNDAAARRSRRR